MRSSLEVAYGLWLLLLVLKIGLWTRLYLSHFIAIMEYMETIRSGSLGFDFLTYLAPSGLRI